MALTITNPTLTNPADKTEIEENFDDIVDKFSNGLTSSDLSGSAGITNAQLANSYYEWTAKFSIGMTDAAGAPSSLQLVDYYPLPNLATDGPYTIVACDYYMTDIGDASSTAVTIASGTVVGGAFSVTTTHVNGQTIASGTAENDAVGSLTVADDEIPGSADNRVLRMIVTLATNALDDIGDKLVVTLKLKRQLRS
jgi:hypothetical protein